MAFGQDLFAQALLEGKVVDSSTKKPLAFVNVYINNTTIGTTSNLAGEFTLPIPLGESDVIFSFVGYQSHKVKVSVPVGGPVKLDVKLIPSKQELENVTIKSTADKDWERLMKRFKKIFFGETLAASQCKILNPWCIDLRMIKVSKRRILVATASQPLEIENLALGYKLLYDLQNFRAGNEEFMFSGFVHFKEIETTDSVQAALWAKNRLDAYHGSSRHIFKSILDRRLLNEGISLYAFRFIDREIPRSTVFAEDLGNIVIPYNPSEFRLDTLTGKNIVPVQQKIEIHYKGRISTEKLYVDIPFSVAAMAFKEPQIEINKDGVLLNPAVMVTSGYLNTLRVPYLLPYDYHPEKQAEFIHAEPFSLEDVKLEGLQEKVYLHTDKSYYYPGDAIWFKGYLMYRYPHLADSMSAPLYVDLISPEHKILETKIFRIDSGRVNGDLFLPGSLPSGNYYLRAYTNWMRNYDDNDIYIKPLPILGFYDNVDFAHETPGETLNSPVQVEIIPNKEMYSTRDSIVITLSVKDEFDNPIQADLSISVTDVQSVVPLSQETDILKFFSNPDSASNVVRKEKTFQVEHGISLSGQFKTDKGKPKKTKLTIVQGNLDDMANLDTDEQGQFWISGFHFFDSTEFAFRGTDEKRRKMYGKIWLAPKDVPSIPSELPVIE
ncbi:MAG TPA: carboxypeptidase-like regulatory domain-containing protein, partial [Chryseolinea sp.]|nr:carboxypeptidase-like regulatory domain-containing protein [Chryseolinea sp.]